MTDTAKAISDLAAKPEILGIANWLFDTTSQVIGACIGALAAYYFGFKLLRMQLTHTENLDIRKQEKVRRKQMHMFFEDTEVHRGELESMIQSAVKTCVEQQKVPIGPIDSEIDMIHKKYLEYREYFNEEEINDIRELRTAITCIKSKLDRYRGLSATDPSTMNLFSGYWNQLKEPLKEIERLFIVFKQHDPMSSDQNVPLSLP
jgi:hypothetical protein